MSGYLFLFVFLALIYGGSWFALKCDGGFTHIKEILGSLPLWQKLVIAAAVILDLVFIIAWLEQNRFVYYWDYSGYWVKSITTADYVLEHSIGETLVRFRQSVKYEDYNIFLSLLVALPMKLIGMSFIKYVSITAVMFLIPSAFVQALTASKLLKDSSLPGNHIFVISFLLALIFTANIYPLLDGYIDAGFLFFASIAFYKLVDYDFSRIAKSRNVAIALMFVLIWISRRYAVYFILGYLTALTVKALWYVHSTRRFKTVILNFVMIGAVSLGVLLIFFRKFLTRNLQFDYAGAYSAYDAPLSSKITSLASSFGYVTVVIMVLALILCVSNRRHLLNFVAFLAMVVAECVCFWHTQDMGEHHRMILSIPVFMMCILSLDGMRLHAADKVHTVVSISRSGTLIGIACIALMILNFAAAFVPVASNLLAVGGIWSTRYEPRVRDDIPALNRLADKLNSLTINSDDGIYVTASGPTLNSSILDCLRLPELNAVPSLMTTFDVDLRDGFPTHIFEAKYVVSTEPAELHMGDGQRIVSHLNDLMNDKNSCIGRHFETLESFELQHHVKAVVHRKVSEIEERDLQELRDYFAEVYPGKDELFGERIRIPDPDGAEQ